MLKAIEEKLANLKKRSLEINDLLIQQDIASDVQKFTKLNKELSDIPNSNLFIYFLSDIYSYIKFTFD